MARVFAGYADETGEPVHHLADPRGRFRPDVLRCALDAPALRRARGCRPVHRLARRLRHRRDRVRRVACRLDAHRRRRVVLLPARARALARRGRSRPRLADPPPPPGPDRVIFPMVGKRRLTFFQSLENLRPA